jgi:hypothetical protein
MKAILIDAKNREVKEVTIDTDKPQLQQYYDLIGCQMIEAAYPFGNDDCIYVDEEGLLNLTEETPFFMIGTGSQPYSGSGVVVGTDYETGDTIAPTLTLEEVKGMVLFLNARQAYQVAKNQ